MCVCFLPIHSGHQVRWTYQPGSHRWKVTQDFSSTFLVEGLYVPNILIVISSAVVLREHSNRPNNFITVPTGCRAGPTERVLI